MRGQTIGGLIRLLRGCAGLAAMFALALIAWLPQASAADCRGAIGPETSITGKTDYDPFGPADLTDAYAVAIANTGAEPCAFGLTFRMRGAQMRLGGVLAYALTDANGQSLPASLPGTAFPAARLHAPLEPAAQGRIAFQLVIPRGQSAAPGIYRDALDLELYALDAAGRIQGPRLHAATLAIAYRVPRVMSVNIRGAELATTLAFGALAKGQQRSIEIQARSNEAYQLDISSDHRGTLALTPRAPGPEWSVAYTATLAGAPLDLGRGSSLRSLPATRPEIDAAYPLTVTIGDVGQKRAGRYEDVITIEIKAAIP
jgi:hypothetical protein